SVGSRTMWPRRTLIDLARNRSAAPASVRSRPYDRAGPADRVADLASHHLEPRMSPDQKALVKETWRKLAPAADAAARLFYDPLFATDPTTRPLFGADLTEQRRKLVQALNLVVQGTRSPRSAGSGRRRSRPPPCALRRHRQPLRHGRRGAAVDARAE